MTTFARRTYGAKTSPAIDAPKARKNELAQIHIAIADLGWSEDDYRAVLRAATGRGSAGELDGTGRKRFLDHLRRCGWVPRNKRLVLTPQQWRVKKLWQELGEAGALQDPSEAALLAYVKRHGGPDALHFINPALANTLIDSLKGWLKRVSTK